MSQRFLVHSRVALPNWTATGAALLRSYGANSAHAFRHLMAADACFGENADWQADREALAAFQGWHEDGHCLAVQGHEWLWILERQATEGLAFYLSAPDRSVRLARCLAFLRSIDPPAGSSWPDTLDQAQVITEKPARGRSGQVSAGRIDLLVTASQGANTFGAVVEAKFGHDLSSNPLPAYHATAGRLGLHAGNCRFVVLAVATDRTIQARLKRNPAWSFQSWRRLLLNLDQELPREADNEDFRRFRRTLLDRSSR